MGCRFRRELRLMAGEVEGHINRELRKQGGEVEAVLILYCRTCDCTHVTLLRNANVDQDYSDGKALAATIEAFRLIQQSREEGEPNNVSEEEEPISNSSVQPIEKRTLN